MTPVSAQLKLSAAALRVTGYMIESNLRVAQVLGRAAFETHPFFGAPLGATRTATPAPAAASHAYAAMENVPPLPHAPR